MREPVASSRARCSICPATRRAFCARGKAPSSLSPSSPSDKIGAEKMDNLGHTANELVQTVSIYALPVLFAITLHEAAHGYVARHFGDMTAHAQRRISLNPMRHVDVIGTIVVPLIILVLSGGRFLFGWAQPVLVDYSALRKPRQHMALVAAAGPAANLVMALIWALALKLSIVVPGARLSEPLELMSQAGIMVNLIFMFLNLLPI